MFFVTNRVLEEGLTTVDNLPRRVHFNLANNQAEQSVYFCIREAENSYWEIGTQDFFGRIRSSKYQHILLFFHGFNNLPESSIFATAQSLQALLDAKRPGFVLVIPLIWPCDNDLGLVKDYFDDQMAADASGYAYARLLQKFLAWRSDGVCTKRINLLAHSMGNRVLARTLEVAVTLGRLQGIPLIFRNVFLCAADIFNESLEPDGEGRYIPESARNVIVYYAADDLAMRASKVANLYDAVSRRLGHTGPENMELVPKNVYSIDCDNFNNRYDPPVGHSYFLTDENGNPGV